MTIVGEKSTEFISRTLTGQVGAGDVNMIEISDGIAQRNQIYSLALMVAPMLYYTKYMPFPIKILIPLGAALFFWTAYITAYSSCMIGLLLSGALLLMIKVGIRAKQIMIIGVLSVTIIIVGTFNPRSFSFLVPPLSAIQKMTEISEYKLKIDAVVESISGAQETHLSLRTDLYKKSWCAFCSSPILGVGMWAWNSDEERERRDKLENVGGHSGTIDILGQTGLVGASLFILMIVSFMQYLRVITPTFFLMRWRFVVYNYMFPCVIYMSVSNRGFSIDDPSLTLMLPGMIYLVKEFRRSISSHIDMRHDLLKY